MTSVRRLSLRRWKARLWSRQHHDPHQPHQNRLFRWGPVGPNSIRTLFSRHTAITACQYWAKTTCPTYPNSSHRDADSTSRSSTL